VSVVEVYRQPNGRWRWRYRDSPDTKALVSNEDFDDPDAATASGRAAYPDVPISGPAEISGPRRKGESSKDLAQRIATWLAPVVVLIAWSRSKRRG
jgi:hypothetical protein